MGKNTDIGWCDHSANFWWGCHKIAKECRQCYAASIASRWKKAEWGLEAPRVMVPGAHKLIESLNQAAKKAGRIDTVFINDMSDFFEDNPNPIIQHRKSTDYWQYICDCGNRDDSTSKMDRVKCSGGCGGWMRPMTISDLRKDAFKTMDGCRNLIFMLLTKRPEHIRKFWVSRFELQTDLEYDTFRPNIWLGTTAGSLETAERNSGHLIGCRSLSPVLFVSAEPLLEKLDLSCFLRCSDCGCDIETDGFGNMVCCGGVVRSRMAIDWLIAGGESGGTKQVVRCEVDWLADLQAQCHDAGVPFFMKQMGSNPIGPPWVRRITHSAGADPTEWPEALRVQEIPPAVIGGSV